MESNNILARFVGMKPHDINELDGFWTNTIKAHDYDNVMNLKFHSDWNWLMEVVEKIESLNFTIDIQNVIGLGQCCRIFSAGTDVVTVRNYKMKIKAVYKACVEFVNWHNEQNNNHGTI